MSNEQDLLVAEALGSLRSTAESTLEIVRDLKRDFGASKEALEKRVSKLERWRAYQLGMAAAAGLLAERLGSYLSVAR